MNKTLTYTVRKRRDGVWEALGDAWPNLKGEGRTEFLAIGHLKKQVQESLPAMYGLYETSNIGATVNLRGVCADEAFAQAWVEENEPRNTWESRHFRATPLLGRDPEAPTDGITTVTVRTIRPEKYLLIDRETGHQWEIKDGHWARATTPNDPT